MQKMQKMQQKQKNLQKRTKKQKPNTATLHSLKVDPETTENYIYF